MNKISKEDTFIAIQDLANSSYDMIIADPLYDLSFNEKAFLHTQFERVCDGTIIVFSPPENQWIIPADQYLFWVKPISTKNTSKSYSRFVEMMFVYQGDKAKWNPDRHWSQYTNVFTDLVDEKNLHPFRKPPSLIERLILNHTDEGDKVFDPFAGSGVVADVCERLDRYCLSFELDERYIK